ncbi:2-hydroxychromene-2-carboxylate isomerase [Spongiibacter sp. KMU-166]|uniref:2-hydroxychromene-2-carboxylate isomerase n=1 Tax=Spongiibacter thalassae TaxID=2721624 RepID=A0ABX1GC56_9GAMM|nr:DsbA family protein [Spongiibacter thalassae]NKI16723.1 2-hydroxychromene-2-carboxylate isomerase [Spongiibacter thalassae]
MNQKFSNQGGAANSSPNAIVRWLTSTIMTRLFTPEKLEARRARAEVQRKKAGEPHRVIYFHQVDDGYSHLAAQVLPALAERYDIELECCLVRGPAGPNLPEPDLLLQLSRYDAYQVAPEYGLEFSRHEQPLRDDLRDRASTILAAQNSEEFIDRAAVVGRAMWAGEADKLEQFAVEFGVASNNDTVQALDRGTTLRTDLGHYSGAMFYYGGEWYWGVDRLYHLEKRLAALGADRKPDTPLLFDRPSLNVGSLKDNGSLTLEVYPSLRSPYTAISFDRAVQLARDINVKLSVRPVLPMVMRGVPATREKGMYIFMDAAREASAAGVPYGRFKDPIGEPVRKAYSLYPWAVEQGRDVEFISSFLHAAFAEGINTNRLSGLKTVVENAGLDWSVAKGLIGSGGWEEPLEENRMAMYEAGLWGVPSFRLLNAQGESVLALWGQDRLWLFARAIQRELNKDQRGDKSQL